MHHPKIRRDTNGIAAKRLKEINAIDPYGLFFAKADVSDILIEELQAALSKLERLLQGQGYRSCIRSTTRNVFLNHSIARLGSNAYARRMTYANRITCAKLWTPTTRPFWHSRPQLA